VHNYVHNSAPSVSGSFHFFGVTPAASVESYQFALLHVKFFVLLNHPIVKAVLTQAQLFAFALFERKYITHNH